MILLTALLLAATASEPDVARVDFLTIGQGAIPIAVRGDLDKGLGFEEAIEAIDGNSRMNAIVGPVPGTSVVEFVYVLPAPTTFDRFAVPDVHETPSQYQTFFAKVDVFGSATAPGEAEVLLASGALAVPKTRGADTEIPVLASAPVRFVTVRLSGGLDVPVPEVKLQFTELVGNGTQEVAPQADHFHGRWSARGVRIELAQEGAVVSGCYDEAGQLSGTVSGGILRARGVDTGDGVVSWFVLAVTDDGTLRGVRSTNGAPFRLYTGPSDASGEAPSCGQIAPPRVGCGSVLHGITFDFDAATIRPESEPLLAALHAALRDVRSPIVVEGHTSSEGSVAYNLELSRLRAEAVVADLVRRGHPAAGLQAVGRGEAEPIASNDDETGRSLNRRVEIDCPESP